MNTPNISEKWVMHRRDFLTKIVWQTIAMVSLIGCSRVIQPNKDIVLSPWGTQYIWDLAEIFQDRKLKELLYMMQWEQSWYIQKWWYMLYRSDTQESDSKKSIIIQWVRDRKIHFEYFEDSHVVNHSEVDLSISMIWDVLKAIGYQHR